MNPDTGETEIYPDDDPSYEFYAGDFKMLLVQPKLKVLNALEMQSLIERAERVEHN